VERISAILLRVAAEIIQELQHDFSASIEIFDLINHVKWIIKFDVMKKNWKFTDESARF